MLKAEGIAFRFLPDPLQIKNALEVFPLIDLWLICITLSLLGPIYSLFHLSHHVVVKLSFQRLDIAIREAIIQNTEYILHSEHNSLYFLLPVIVVNCRLYICHSFYNMSLKGYLSHTMD
jgi:hypothetical protein